jgi:hypothetical protein
MALIIYRTKKDDSKIYWRPLYGVSRFVVQISKHQDFSREGAVVDEIDAGLANELDLPELDNTTRFYCRVVAEMKKGRKQISNYLILGPTDEQLNKGYNIFHLPPELRNNL